MARASTQEGVKSSASFGERRICRHHGFYARLLRRRGPSPRQMGQICCAIDGKCADTSFQWELRVAMDSQERSYADSLVLRAGNLQTDVLVPATAASEPRSPDAPPPAPPSGASSYIQPRLSEGLRTDSRAFFLAVCADRREEGGLGRWFRGCAQK